jgi:predicted flavoprotein YhiN
VQISTGSKKARMAFDEDLLFTHRGPVGPGGAADLQLLAGGHAAGRQPGAHGGLPAALAQAKARSRKLIANELATAGAQPPGRRLGQREADWQRPINEATDKALARLAEQLARWELTPTGTEGYKKAEVTLGGIDTAPSRSRPWSARPSRGCTSLVRWWM